MCAREISRSALVPRKLIRNGVTEKDVRDYLNRLGYHGNGARFEYLDLYAIARPGWIQVFKFAAWASDQTGTRTRLLGVVRDDERVGTEIHLAADENEQRLKAEAWSHELITAQRQPLTLLHWMLLGLFGFAMALALLGALSSSGT